jgi:hypothetical protein
MCPLCAPSGLAARLEPPVHARKRGRTRWKRAGPMGHEELASCPTMTISRADAAC